ncbi:MAG: TMEM175 family protein [Desulfosudis oleivorans]|nr:TMEM175 family protein [Desulfosudis oleivorans]
MTLLVTSMILPHAADAPALSAAGALSLLIPDFIHYVIAFFVLAAFWIAHHLLFNQIRLYHPTLSDVEHHRPVLCNPRPVHNQFCGGLFRAPFPLLSLNSIS